MGEIWPTGHSLLTSYLGEYFSSFMKMSFRQKVHLKPELRKIFPMEGNHELNAALTINSLGPPM